MRVPAVMAVAIFLAASVSAQTLTMGNDVSSPNSGDQASTTTRMETQARQPSQAGR